MSSNVPELIATVPEGTPPSSASVQISNPLNKVGQSFKGNGYTVTSVKLRLSRSGDDGDGFFAACIYEATGEFGVSDLPIGAPLAVSETKAYTDINTNAAWYEFTFPSGFKTVENKTYFIAFPHDGLGVDSANFIVVYYVTNASLFNGGRYVIFNNNFWSAPQSNRNMIFELYGVKPVFTVTYDANGATGGEVPVDSVGYQESDLVVVLGVGSLVKTNYDFLGWALNPSAVVPDYVENGTFNIGSDDVVLFAVWEIKPVFTVIYHANGATSGTPPIDSDSPYYRDMQAVVLANTGNLALEHHDFGGWMPDINTPEIVRQPGYQFNVVENTNFRAKWVEHEKFTVAYDSNGATGGEVPVDSNSYYEGDSVTVLGQNSLTKQGHLFVGWAREKTAPLLVYLPNSTFNIDTLNVVLYAVWLSNPVPPVTYAVTYVGNGATCGSAPVDSNSPYVSGSTVTVLDQGTLERIGHIFKGWALVFNAPTPQYLQGNTFTITQNTILYAVWEENLIPPTTYIVAYMSNWPLGVAGLGSAPVDPNSYQQYDIVTVKGNTSNLTKTGYVFKGWATTQNAAVPTFLVSNGGFISPSSFVMGDTNVTLYAVWYEEDGEPEPDTYTVTYHGNGATSGNVPVDNKQYLTGETVTVQGNTGNLAKSNYTFAGWAYTSAATVPVFSVNGQVYPPVFNMGIVNVDLYVVWTPIPLPNFTVTYNRNGATSGATPMDPGSPYVSESTVTVLSQGALDRTNHTFLGWATTQNATMATYQPNNTFTITANVVFFAVWQEHTQYTVTYDGNGNTSGSAPVDQNSPYYTGSLVVVKGQFFLRRYGYKFLGWSTTTLGGVVYVKGDNFTITGDTVLFAVWQTLPRYTVTYRSNGATDGLTPVDPNDYLAGETVTVQNNTGNLTREGYRLLGWAYDSSAVVPGFAIVQGEMVPVVFSMPECNVVFYAVWEKADMYTVTYDGNGATDGEVPQNSHLYAVNSVVSVRGNTNGLGRDGYNFKGWASISNATGPDYIVDEDNNKVTPATFIITSNVTLYAVWEIKPVFTITYHANYPDNMIGTGSVPVDSNNYYLNTTVTVQANTGGLDVEGCTFLGWLYGTTMFTVTNNTTVQPPTLTITGVNIDLHAIWSQDSPTEKPPCPHYGNTDKVRLLCRLETPEGLRIPDEALDDFLCIATEWANGELDKAEVSDQIRKTSNNVQHVCNLYAAGRYLQRRTPEEKTHPYIEEAQMLMDNYLEVVYGLTKDDENLQDSVVIVGRCERNW